MWEKLTNFRYPDYLHKGFILFLMVAIISLPGVFLNNQVAMALDNYSVSILASSNTASSPTQLTFSTTIPQNATFLKQVVLHIPESYTISNQFPNPFGQLIINIPGTGNDSGITVSKDFSNGVASTLMTTTNNKYSYTLTLDRNARTLTVLASVTRLSDGSEVSAPPVPDTVELSVVLNQGALTNPMMDGTYSWNVEGLNSSGSKVTLSSPTTTITGGTASMPGGGVSVQNPPVLTIDPTPEQVQLAQLPSNGATVSPSADQAIELKTGDGVQISIPQGALADSSAPVKMQVKIGEITAPPHADTTAVVLDPVKYQRSFGIEGVAEGSTQFHSPVTLTFPFSLTDLPASAQADQLAVYWWNPGKQDWVKLGGVIDKAKNTISVPTYHFSTYAVMVDAQIPPNRLAGSDRFATANAVADNGWKTGADSVVIVNAYSFPDALAATPLAFKTNAPILLTDANTLTSATLTEIQKLAPKHIYLIGGMKAISEDVEDALKNMYGTDQVIRYGGKDRYETAAQIAIALGTKGKAVIASGEDEHFPDALAMSSFAAYQGIPILFSYQDALPSATREALTQQKVTSTYVAGGIGALTDNVFAALPGATRYGGVDRYDTAVKIATGLQLNASRVYVATGLDFPDALVAGNLAAHSFSPLIMLDRDIPSYTSNYLTSHHGPKVTLTMIGSEGVVSANQENRLRAVIK